MAIPAAYADATALIGLARIDRLDLLNLLPVPVRVTRMVWVEVTADVEKPGAQQLLAARHAGLLTVVEEGEAADFPFLDSGEGAGLLAAAGAQGEDAGEGEQPSVGGRAHRWTSVSSA